MHSKILNAARFSKSAYSSVRVPGNLAHKFHNKWTSSTWFYLEEDDTNWIIHRGSQQPRDMVVDLLAYPPIRHLGIWVHMGFGLAHKSIQKNLKKILERVRKNGKPLICTGHSLGAVQAEYTHLQAVQLGIPSTLLAFGKPRGWLKRSKKRFPDQSVWSVCSGSDIVCRVPRLGFTVGCSSQNFVLLANNGDTYVNPDQKFVEDDFSYRDMVSDHSMDLYLKRLKELA